MAIITHLALQFATNSQEFDRIPQIIETICVIAFFRIYLLLFASFRSFSQICINRKTLVKVTKLVRIMMLKSDMRTPNLRRRFFLEKIEIVKNLMKRGDYLKDIHSEVFDLNEISYSQFARYVQRYIKGVLPVKRVPYSEMKLTSEATPSEVKILPTSERNTLSFHKPFLENRDEIY